MPTLPKNTGIDPQAILAMRDLELRARVIVEGIWSGLHRSPLAGFSVEFTEYRQYSPGDDLRFLDWRALAKTDRAYIKKFLDETNLRCLLAVDASRSMSFGSLSYNKADYARTLCATLSYFLGQQRDVIGLAVFDSSIRDYVPPRWRPGHLRRLLAALERKPEGRSTDLGSSLREVAALFQKRGLILVVSDFLAPVETWDTQLGELAAAGHDVRAMQILDPAELSLNFGKASRWTDLEDDRDLYIDPELARKAYLEKLSGHQAAVQTAMDRRGITLQTISTDQPFDFALLEFMRSDQSKNLKAFHGRRTR